MAAKFLACLALVLALSACSGASDSTRPSDETSENADSPTSSAAIGGESTGRCHEEYSQETLPNRAFAFDGTVTEVAEETTDDEAHHGRGYVDVTFEVHEWFTADGPDQIVVQMLPPGVVTSVGEAGYDIGSQLLVSGEPRWGGQPLDSPVAFACGFTRTYDAETASEWRDVLAGSDG